MTSILEDALGRAYELDQLHNDQAGAVAWLRSKFASDVALTAEAVDEHRRLAAVVEARRVGDQHGDHVSWVFCNLLTKALEN